MKELLFEMFNAKHYVGDETAETLQQMRDNFFEILKNTIWFRDFEKCILKQLNFYWRWHENLTVPDYWLYGGPSDESFDDLVKIKDFLMKKLQLDDDGVDFL